MSEGTKAVFLSYASQDSESARRIAEALRAAGLEVWFDQNELVGGDAWDAKIRKQIKECALFVPIISANTQARAEGYFRLEWRLADKRTELMGKSRAFLLPVCIDSTRDSEADVPDSFNAVQWTRLPGGETPPAFCARVKTLLDGKPSGVTSRPEIFESAGAQRTAQTPKPFRPWLIPVIGGTVAVAVIALWLMRQPAPIQPPSSSPAVSSARPVAATSSSPELSQLRARIIPDRWQRGDFEALSPLIDRILEKNPEYAEAWALRSIIHTLQVVRLIDPGTKPLEAGRTAAERALRLAPGLPMGQLAIGLHHTANVSRGGDPRASREPLDQALATLTPEPLTRYAELVSYWLGYDFEGTDRCALAWLAADLNASFPAWVLVSKGLATRQPAELERWAAQSVQDPNITGVRTLLNLAEMHLYLRSDLAASRTTLDRVPASSRSIARVVHMRWLLAMAEKRWDAALQELALVPDTMLLDVAYNGPKAFLAGLSHLAAGRQEVAGAQFKESERLLREVLATDPENEALRVVLAATLAYAGRGAEARNELMLVEPLVRGRVPNVYRGRLVVAIAQTYVALGEPAAAAFWLRKLFAEPSNVPLTPASFRLDPRFIGAIESPEIRALLQEFAHLDQPAAQKTADGRQNTAQVVDQKSVAVLAFANLSDDKANEYFSDGISEELLNVLAKVPGLKVSARTSAFHFKGKDTPIADIAKQLGVAYVVEGSVRKAGDKVRITAQLIKAADSFHVWSDTFTRDLKDIFAVQDEIAGLIAQNLQLKLGTDARAAKAVNPEAYRFTLEGRHYWLQRTTEGFERAEAAFNAALKIDPDFAQAHAGLADVWSIRAWYSLLGGDAQVADLLGRAETEALTALRLEPRLFEAHAALGAIRFNQGRYNESERHFGDALRLNHNYSFANHWQAQLHGNLGRLDDLLAGMDRAIEADPLAYITLTSHAVFLVFANRHEQALRLSDRALALRADPFVPLLGQRALILFGLGRREEAVTAARLVLGQPQLQPRWWMDAICIHVLRRAGLNDEALAQARRVRATLPPGSQLHATVEAAAGNVREALDLLGANGMASTGVAHVFYSAVWDEARRDPRLAEVLARLGLGSNYLRARESLARVLGQDKP